MDKPSTPPVQYRGEIIRFIAREDSGEFYIQKQRLTQLGWEDRPGHSGLRDAVLVMILPSDERR